MLNKSLIIISSCCAMLACIALTSFIFNYSLIPRMEFESIEKGDIKVEINSTNGGRIAQVKIKGKKILYEHSEAESGTSYGSVWWPSPQAVWQWPPPSTLDNEAYVIELTKHYAKLDSRNCEATGIQLAKEIELCAGNIIKLTYTATNTLENAIKFAHWEITRLPKSGRIVFPAGKPFEKSPMPTNSDFWFHSTRHDIKDLTNKSGTYFDFEITSKTNEIPGLKNVQKLFANGKGWSAFITKQYVLIKKFEDIDISSLAPAQGEIEVYVDKAQNFIELEQQGAYQELLPGESSTWQVHWLIFDFKERSENKDLTYPELEQIIIDQFD